jgi:glycosyltransferase involved in cell wall biosynthesis
VSLVSVVIPTLHRPQLVLRAIASVLNQTLRELELIVVVDGPDAQTAAAIRSLSDPRLQILVNPKSMTAAGARNIGAEIARGNWIAFLDDDDEWLPTKLERQIKLASASGAGLVSCLSRVVTPNATYIWPQVVYDNRVPIDEYLFDRRNPFIGTAFIQTSSYFVPRELFNRIRFRVGSPHDDWEFVLRLSKQVGARIETVPEALVVFHFEEPRTSLGSKSRWMDSAHWIDSMRPLITPRAYSGFCLGVTGARAAKEGAYGAIPQLVYMAFRWGAPRLWHVAAFVSFWFTSHGLRRRLRAAYRAVRRP